MPFATSDDIEQNWRPLTSADKSWATLLLGAAERWIRGKVPGIADDDQAAKVVSIAVVRNALQPGEHAGHVSYSKTLGPRSRAGTLSNPDAALTWLPWMKEQLGISTTAQPRATFGDGGFRECW